MLLERNYSSEIDTPVEASSFSPSDKIHTLIQSSSSEDVLSQFLTTNSTGFLRDCSNMIQGISLCIERLEKGFINAEKGIKPLSEVLNVFREKVLTLKLFQNYDIVLSHKIEDALVNRVKMVGDTTTVRKNLVLQYRNKCSSEDVGTFDKYVSEFNKHIVEIRQFLLLGTTDEDTALYLQKQIPLVRGIIKEIEGVISGK